MQHFPLVSEYYSGASQGFVEVVNILSLAREGFILNCIYCIINFKKN